MRTIRALIIGAGIGGCTLSLALRKLTEQARNHGRGVLFEATMFEQAPKIEAVGAGLSLGPNGLRILDSLQLYNKIQSLGGETQTLHTFNDKGTKLGTFDYTFMRNKYGYPIVTLERAELQALLVHEAMHLPPLSSSHTLSPPVLFGKKCVSVHRNGKGVIAHFSDGSSVEGDVLIGADGLNSAVRASLAESGQGHSQTLLARLLKGGPSPSPPSYSGLSCTLGVTSPVPDTTPGQAFWTVGSGRIYGTWAMGGGKQFWFLTQQEPVTADNRARWTPTEALHGMDEMWNWFHPYNAHELFSRTVRAVKIGLFDFPCRSVLLSGGASAHGGGSREDSTDGDEAAAVPAAVRMYEGFRRERVARMAGISRRAGQWQSSHNPLTFLTYQALLRITPQFAFERSVDWIYRYKDSL